MVVPNNPKREQVLKLIEEKDRIEKRISEIGEILRAVSFSILKQLHGFLIASFYVLF